MLFTFEDCVSKFWYDIWAFDSSAFASFNALTFNNDVVKNIITIINEVINALLCITRMACLMLLLYMIQILISKYVMFLQKF